MHIAMQGWAWFLSFLCGGNGFNALTVVFYNLNEEDKAFALGCKKYETVFSLGTFCYNQIIICILLLFGEPLIDAIIIYNKISDGYGGQISGSPNIYDAQLTVTFYF